MRTKTLFLAAAALAAGLASSQAQQSNVFSVNIVGYVNVPLAANTQYLLSNPLDNGTTNDAVTLGAAWSNGTVVQTWNGSAFVPAQKAGGNWTVDPTLAPGAGFFVKGTKAQTLTFVGSAPTSNNYVLAAKVNVLVGAYLPIQGAVTDSGPNTLNLGSFNNGTVVQTWTGSAFSPSQKAGGNWTVPSMTVTVPGGFFVKPGGTTPTTWSQWLQ